MTISYDGRSSTMRHLIEAMLSLGAKIEQSSPSPLGTSSVKYRVFNEEGPFGPPSDA